MAQKELSNNAFLVSETDEKGVIKFANDDFCEVAEYQLDELVGQPHNIIRHNRMPSYVFKEMWNDLKQGKTWIGFLLNKTKNGNEYWVYSTIFPTTRNGETSYISCRRKTSDNEIVEWTKKYNL